MNCPSCGGQENCGRCNNSTCDRFMALVRGYCDDPKPPALSPESERLAAEILDELGIRDWPGEPGTISVNGSLPGMIKILAARLLRSPVASTLEPLELNDFWMDAGMVRCVECVNCGFQFGAYHANADGSGYECPECRPVASLAPTSLAEIPGCVEAAIDAPFCEAHLYADCSLVTAANCRACTANMLRAAEAARPPRPE